VETADEALIRLRDEIKKRARKMKAGKAFGATTGGSVCAMSFGKSGLGQMAARAIFLKERKQKKKLKKFTKATKKQRDYAQSLGITLGRKCTKMEARKIIGEAVTRRKQEKKNDKETNQIILDQKRTAIIYADERTVTHDEAASG